MAQAAVVIEHPNREKAESRATKAIVVALLLVSAAIMGLITVGGWNALQGAKSLQVAYIVVYVVLSVQIGRWRSGLLPVAAALAIVLLIFAAISGPQWFVRDKNGFADPTLDESVLGLLTVVLVPLQLLLIVFAARGFSQKWSVEIERSAGPGPHAPQPA
jgi:hypothetical protein